MTRPPLQPAGQTRGSAARAVRCPPTGSWLALALALLALTACSSGPDPAVAPSSPTFAGPARLPTALPNPGPVPGQVFVAPPPNGGVRDGAALAAACRQDADRIVVTRDRGQLMRDDERDARIGTDSSIYARRTESDRLGRIFERDRIAADCVQQNTRSAPRR